jgi:hypothetical protein
MRVERTHMSKTLAGMNMLLRKYNRTHVEDVNNEHVVERQYHSSPREG